MVFLSASTIWSVAVPFKVRILMWLVIKEKQNTLDLLAYKKISQDGPCILCNNAFESCQHIFFLDSEHTRFIRESIKKELRITDSP